MTLTAERACNSANILSETTELQGLARANSQSPTAAESRISFQVVHVVGAVYAWRLIEAEGPAEGRKYRRRMLCFASTTQLRDALEAIAAWMRADREFCATHAIIHAGFHAVTTDWVHPEDFDDVFGPSRQLLRKEFWADGSHLSSRSIMLHAGYLHDRAPG